MAKRILQVKLLESKNVVLLDSSIDTMRAIIYAMY